jgi:hypothetical protein
MFTLSFIGSFIYGGLIHLGLSYFFPQKYNDLKIQFSYNIIYVYSLLCIYATKQLNKIKKYPEFKYVYSIIDKYCESISKNIEIISNGQIVYLINRQNLSNWDPICYDFILYTHKPINMDNDSTATKSNKIISHSLPESYEYTLCKYSFISVNVSIVPNESSNTAEALTYPLTLSNNAYNYYVVNNMFNNFVIIYLINNQHRILYNVDTKYTITLIDNNANIVTISHTEEFVLNETEYIINKTPKEYNIKWSNCTLAAFSGNISNNIIDNMHFVDTSDNEDVIADEHVDAPIVSTVTVDSDTSDETREYITVKRVEKLAQDAAELLYKSQ